MVISQNLHSSSHIEIIVLCKYITIYTHSLIFTEFTKQVENLTCYVSKYNFCSFNFICDYCIYITPSPCPPSKLLCPSFHSVSNPCLHFLFSVPLISCSSSSKTFPYPHCSAKCCIKNYIHLSNARNRRNILFWEEHIDWLSIQMINLENEQTLNIR